MTAKFQRSFGRKIKDEPEPAPSSSEAETSNKPESETELSSDPYAYPYTYGTMSYNCFPAVCSWQLLYAVACEFYLHSVHLLIRT